jgi:hypothetical protein
MMKTIFLGVLLAACVVAVGCSSSSDNGASSSGTDGGTGGSDSGVVNTLQFPASNAPWTVSEDVTFTGKGANDVGAIAITHGVGTIEFQNESVSAFFFNATGVPTGTADGGDVDGGEFAGDRDYEIIAVQQTRVIVAFITCTSSALDFIYYETTDGIASPKELAATGTCSVLEKSTTEQVTLPAVDMPTPNLLFDFSISGKDISYNGMSIGSASFAGDTYQLYPFHLVDCSNCASPGWDELHSFFWNASKQTACIGILYLEESAPTNVELAYTVCLPGLTNPLGGNSLNFPATWTVP